MAYQNVSRRLKDTACEKHDYSTQFTSPKTTQNTAAFIYSLLFEVLGKIPSISSLDLLLISKFWMYRKLPKKPKNIHHIDSSTCATNLISRFGKIKMEQIITDKKTAFDTLTKIAHQEGWIKSDSWTALHKMERNLIRKISVKCADELLPKIATVPIGRISTTIISASTPTDEVEDLFITSAIKAREPKFGFLSLNTTLLISLNEIYCNEDQIAKLPPHLQLIPKFSNPHNLLSFSKDSPYKKHCRRLLFTYTSLQCLTTLIKYSNYRQ